MISLISKSSLHLMPSHSHAVVFVLQEGCAFVASPRMRHKWYSGGRSALRTFEGRRMGDSGYLDRFLGGDRGISEAIHPIMRVVNR